MCLCLSRRGEDFWAALQLMDLKTKVFDWSACNKNDASLKKKQLSCWCSSNRRGHLCRRRRWPVWDRCPAAGSSGVHEGPGHGTLRATTGLAAVAAAVTYGGFDAVYYLEDTTEKTVTDNILDQDSLFPSEKTIQAKASCWTSLSQPEDNATVTSVHPVLYWCFYFYFFY